MRLQLKKKEKIAAGAVVLLTPDVVPDMTSVVTQTISTRLTSLASQVNTTFTQTDMNSISSTQTDSVLVIDECLETDKAVTCYVQTEQTTQVNSVEAQTEFNYSKATVEIQTECISEYATIGTQTSFVSASDTQTESPIYYMTSSTVQTDENISSATQTVKQDVNDVGAVTDAVEVTTRSTETYENVSVAAQTDNVSVADEIPKQTLNKNIASSLPSNLNLLHSLPSVSTQTEVFCRNPLFPVRMFGSVLLPAISSPLASFLNPLGKHVMWVLCLTNIHVCFPFFFSGPKSSQESFSC